MKNHDMTVRNFFVDDVNVVHHPQANKIWNLNCKYRYNAKWENDIK